MKEIEQVSFQNQTYAIILRSEYKNEGVKFFTPNDFSQQLGYMRHSKGHVILPHIHNLHTREVHYTKEVLYKVR